MDLYARVWHTLIHFTAPDNHIPKKGYFFNTTVLKESSEHHKRGVCYDVQWSVKGAVSHICLIFLACDFLIVEPMDHYYCTQVIFIR